MQKVLRMAVLCSFLIFTISVVPFAVAQSDVVCPDGNPELSFATGALGRELEITVQLLNQYMELCPNVTAGVFEVEDEATDRVILYNQFLAARSSAVDIYQIDVTWPGIFAEHMVDLYSYASPDSEIITQHFAANILNNTVNGALVGMPWYTDAGLFYYRTDLLEKYGLEVPQTWDEMAEAAQIIQDGERAEGNSEFWGYVWQGKIGEPTTVNALEWQASNGGGTIISPDGAVQVNNPETIEAIERAASWVGTISPPTVLGHGIEDSRSIWQAGNAAFMRNWPFAYNLGNAANSPIAGLFDIGPLPAGSDGQHAATLGGWQLAVSRYSQDVDAAAALVLFLTSYEAQKFRAIEGGFNPTIQELYTDAEVLVASPFFSRLADVFLVAVARPSSISGDQYFEVSRLYYNAVHSVLRGEVDAQIAVEDLEFDLEDLVQEFR